MKPKRRIYNIILSLGILAGTFAVGILFQRLNVQEHITTVFVFAVFLISLFTEGYVYGIVSAAVSVIAINYAFTYPFFKVNFTIPENLISGIVMTVISILTSALTVQLKRHEAVKAEGERERMRANLLRAISHDLRTPLTTIYGSSTTLLEKTETMTEDQRRQIISGIKEDSEWLIRMVENILSVTRIDSGALRIEKAPTVLEELIDSVMLKFRQRFPGQQVSISIPEDMVVIPMDALLIEQVIMNLLENAVHHGAGMTELSLRVFLAEDQAVFEVKDNGCGIERERIGSIFSGIPESENRIADGKKRNSGFGLTVCATIIRAHGGKISAENVKTGGAMFRFALSTEEEI